MRVGIDSQLSSILAITTEPKRNQIPHSLFWGFGADTIHSQGSQAAEFKFQVESKFEPLLVIWQSLPKAISEENQWF